jgi:hypothetical protein
MRRLFTKGLFASREKVRHSIKAVTTAGQTGHRKEASLIHSPLFYLNCLQEQVNDPTDHQGKSWLNKARIESQR